jgi:hypothetical protein
MASHASLARRVASVATLAGWPTARFLLRAMISFYNSWVKQFFKTFLGKAPNTRSQPLGEEAELPSGYWQKCGNFLPFSLKHCVSVNSDEKSRELWKLFRFFSYFCSFLLFSTIPL